MTARHPHGPRQPRPRIEAYRAGYLPGERRRLEQSLQSGSLGGVAATNALELGVDISGVDAVVMAGFPGTRAAFWQQAGRAGRRTRPSVAILVARRQPLDAYLFDHPETLLAAPVETTVLHPENPYVLCGQLAAAAQELPLTAADGCYFGGTMEQMIADLEQSGVLRRRPAGWFWTRTERAVDLIDLRSAGGRSIEIVEAESGRVLGYANPSTADATVHPGAVYLHQGDSYLCEELDLEAGEAVVRAARPAYYTQPRRHSGVHVLAEERTRPLGEGRLAYGTVEVRSQVTGYLRRDLVSHQVWDESPLDLPQRVLQTRACWWTIAAEVADPALSQAQLAGGVHGIEHGAVQLLPMYAPCDRWDIGAVSAVAHPDTAGLTVFVHDGQPGGSGFAERGYEVADAWLAATLSRFELCPCAVGCPACIVTASCANSLLDKHAAIRLLRQLTGSLGLEEARSPAPGARGKPEGRLDRSGPRTAAPAPASAPAPAPTPAPAPANGSGQR